MKTLFARCCWVLPAFCFALLIYPGASEIPLAAQNSHDITTPRTITLSNYPYPDNGLVTAVYDGDTVKIEFQDGVEKKVRLIGIDSPEIDDAREDVSFWAHMAKRFAFFHLYRKEVRLTYDQEPQDKYGRVLAYIWINGHTLFNEFIIREGYAFAFLDFPYNSDYQKRFKEAEKEARRLKRGLWGKENPSPISAEEARRHLGRFCTVRFVCSGVDLKRQYIYLHSKGDEFEAVIPREKRNLFPEISSFANQVLLVTGFLEEFRGIPQIMVFFPRQIIKSRRSGHPWGTRS